MDQLLHGSEIVDGLALLVGLVVVVAMLRPPRGTLHERAIVSFPGAWMVVGLPLNFSFGVAVALIAVGTCILR